MQGVGVAGGNIVLQTASAVTAACNFSRKSANSISNFRSFIQLDPKFCLANGPLKFCPSVSAPSYQRSWGGLSRNKACKTYFTVRAEGNQYEASNSIAPLQLESPTGQFLTQILKNHPHLLLSAVDQQLERLIADRDAVASQEQPSTTGMELVLYRRIAEMKAQERRKALEEIIYALIVQKFMDAGVSMIPTISPSADDGIGKVDTWPNQQKELQSVHSTEAFEMIMNHLALVLGNRLLDPNAIAQIGKLRVGQVYAASVMYGYFLRRVDQRFQLEKSMKMLPGGLNQDLEALHLMDNHLITENEAQPSAEASSTNIPGAAAPAGPDLNPPAFGGVGVKPCKLRTYVMSFDPDTLQRYATMRSKEGVSIIEKQSDALFGKPEIRVASGGLAAASKDETIRISFSGLSGLVLEAVTFGSFLWDVESYVDSRYHFVTN